MVMLMKLTTRGFGLIYPASQNRARAVNQIAQDLIVSLDTILGVKTDFETTQSNSTTVVDVNTGESLYKVRTVTIPGGFQIGVYPRTNRAREYLPQINIG